MLVVLCTGISAHLCSTHADSLSRCMCPDTGFTHAEIGYPRDLHGSHEGGVSKSGYSIRGCVCSIRVDIVMYVQLG